MKSVTVIKIDEFRKMKDVKLTTIIRKHKSWTEATLAGWEFIKNEDSDGLNIANLKIGKKVSFNGCPLFIILNKAVDILIEGYETRLKKEKKALIEQGRKEILEILKKCKKF